MCRHRPRRRREIGRREERRGLGPHPGAGCGGTAEEVRAAVLLRRGVEQRHALRTAAGFVAGGSDKAIAVLHLRPLEHVRDVRPASWPHVGAGLRAVEAEPRDTVGPEAFAPGADTSAELLAERGGHERDQPAAHRPGWRAGGRAQREAE